MNKKLKPGDKLPKPSTKPNTPTRDKASLVKDIHAPGEVVWTSIILTPARGGWIEYYMEFHMHKDGAMYICNEYAAPDHRIVFLTPKQVAHLKKALKVTK